MAYHIHWQFRKDSPRAHKSEPIPSRELALAEACVLVRSDAFALWIEGPNGERIEADEIRRVCRDREPWRTDRVA